MASPSPEHRPGDPGATVPGGTSQASAAAATTSGYTLPAEEAEMPRLRTMPWQLVLEYVLFFGGLPWALRLAGRAVPMIPVLIACTATGFWLLYREGALTRSFLMRWPSPRKRKRVKDTLMWVALGLPLLLALTLILNPDALFSFPIERPGFWLVVMIAYPLLSVIPQEVLFRVVFFHRYRALFPTRTAMIAASAIAFGWAHIIYGSWVSVVLSAVGGVVFGVTWFRSRSLMLVAMQHALFGQWIFTVGLGSYFYRGAGS